MHSRKTDLVKLILVLIDYGFLDRAIALMQQSTIQRCSSCRLDRSCSKYQSRDPA